MSELSKTPVPQTPAAANTRGRHGAFLGQLSRYGALIFLIVLGVVFSILEPAFIEPLNLFNVMRQVSITGLLAIGMTFVILTGGIDLGVGSLLAVAGLVAATMYKAGTGVPLAALAAALTGVAGGALEGLGITKLRVPPFVVTLGSMSAYRGAALLLSKGTPISSFGADFRYWGQGMIGPVPVPVVIFLVFAAVAHVVLRYTQYGRYIYAVGGNPEAARLSGLNTPRLIGSVYVIMGLFCGLGGFILASRLNSAEQVAGIGYELTVIASVVIGGTSLFGGEGAIFGTVVGALLIGVITNGLTLMNVSSYYQQIIIGLIIVLAVYFDQVIKGRRR